LDAPLRAADRIRRKLAPTGSSTGQARPPTDDELGAQTRQREHREDQVRSVFDALSLVHSPSSFVLSRFRAWGLSDTDRFRHLPQGLSREGFSPRTTRPGSQDGPLRVGFLGTYAPHKGPQILVEATRHLAPGTITLRMHGPVGGDPAFRARLEDSRPRDGSIELGPRLDRAQVAAFLAEIDVLAMPSLWYECQPLGILESFFVGTPVLVSDLGGMAELVEDGKGGRRAKPGDAEAWARALIAWRGSAKTSSTSRRPSLSRQPCESTWAASKPSTKKSCRAPRSERLPSLAAWRTSVATPRPERGRTTRPAPSLAAVETGSGPARSAGSCRACGATAGHATGSDGNRSSVAGRHDVARRGPRTRRA
ncbi:MAG: glycosyltransferase, partial [Planctomycetes bacterium]|nr:glycosyltransferase [Planctomycetota bacterium]